jgi:hypothetical protein
VADEQRQSWWKSIPGMLTAATGFVAALSGLVAGINQLGLLRREQASQQEIAAAPASREPATAPVAPSTGGGSSTTAPVPSPGVPRAPEPARTPAAPAVGTSGGTPTRPPTPSKPTPAATPAPSAGSAVDTAAATPFRIPKGTAIELAVPSRVCAPESGMARFTARLTGPLKVNGTAVLPANTSAILHLGRAGGRAVPEARLDSLVGRDLALAIPSSDVRLRRNAINGTCVRANARLTAILDATVTVRRS